MRDDFRPDSDIDLLYELDHDHLVDRQHLDYFFGFVDAIRGLLTRKVDFVWYPKLKNPYFKEEVEKTKVLIYEQKRQEIPV